VKRPSTRPPLWLAAGFALALAAAGALGLAALAGEGGLSLETLRARRRELAGVVEARPLTAALAYLALYVAGTASLVPGMLWVILFGALAFGFWAGFALSLTGAVTGGALVFLLARSAFGAPLRARAERRLSGRVGAELARHPVSLMLALRFLPVIPYPVANIAPALFGVRLRDFLLAAPIGLAPSVAAYALIGAGLGAALDAGEAVDPLRLATQFAPGLFALAALALAPVAWRLATRYRGSASGRDGAGDGPASGSR
jgi:uncharacterized membrane protein YdjX (TVP38/TMEM64 family)